MLLGEGRFGQVRKANVTGNIVAVKTVKGMTGSS